MMEAKLVRLTLDEAKLSITNLIYGHSLTPFGKCCVGATKDNGICFLSFEQVEELALKMLKKYWPFVSLTEDTTKITGIVDQIFGSANGKQFYVILKGTDFQVKVWQALCSISEGTTVSYEDVARMIGQPKAVRATANAIANNQIAFLIPCHRVIRKSGEIHQYRWGPSVKKAMLTYESKQ